MTAGLEVLAALLLGLTVVWIILEPLYRPQRPVPAFDEPEELEETRRGIALIALKEIDFDRETGKLSDQDHAVLKQRYTAEALAAIREEEASASADPLEALVAGRVAVLEGVAGAVCPRCGPRPEPDPSFCSSCGERLVAATSCARCGTPVVAGDRFCTNCGTEAAA